MAEHRPPKVVPLSSQQVVELKRLVWGNDKLRDDVFQRWSQGFVVSEHEPTALVQYEGGPCAVIAPVQAFLLRHALFDYEGDWRHIPVERSNALLVAAFRDILVQCCGGTRLAAVVVLESEAANQMVEEQQQQDSNRSSLIESASVSSNENDSKTEAVHFHSQIRVLEVDVGDNNNIEQVLLDRLDSFRNLFGVILFLYSVLLTKGVDQVKNEMQDPNEPLIDGTHGHGSQSLINLLLTGRAVSNVWDNDKDVCGLKLQGINRQAVVGFLTLLEHLRYCEVGWFLKCPQFPVWVLGSETHLTVLFSKERGLCTPETPEAAARRIFKSFDPEGNNFISSVLLGDVLRALDLFCDPDYVDVMKRKLDGEELGVILLNTFMDEFFPNQEPETPEAFELFHYNGLKRSCSEQKVVYQSGRATVVDFEVKMYSENSPILTCLQTKWPGLDVEWTSDAGAPSLN